MLADELITANSPRMLATIPRAATRLSSHHLNAS
jgi:hypothetical protein